MKNFYAKKEEGFSLIEVLVAVSIASMLILVSVGFISNSFGNFNRETATVSSQQDLRRVITFMSGHILPAKTLRVLPSITSTTENTINTAGNILEVTDYNGAKYIFYFNTTTKLIMYKNVTPNVTLPISSKVFDFKVTKVNAKNTIKVKIQADAADKYSINTYFTPRNSP